MKIAFAIQNPFDAMPRVLQILRLSNADIRRLEVWPCSGRYRAFVDVAVADHRQDHVLAKLSALIDVVGVSKEPDAHPAAAGHLARCLAGDVDLRIA